MAATLATLAAVVLAIAWLTGAAYAREFDR